MKKISCTVPNLITGDFLKFEQECQPIQIDGYEHYPIDLALGKLLTYDYLNRKIKTHDRWVVYDQTGAKICGFDFTGGSQEEAIAEAKRMLERVK